MQLYIGDLVKIQNKHEPFWVRITHLSNSDDDPFITGIIVNTLDYGFLYSYNLGSSIRFYDYHILDRV